MNLIEPAKLLDLFEPVLGLYRKDTKGLSLNEILQTDWHVFAVKKDEIQNKLLREIVGNPSLFSVKYKSAFLKDEKIIEQWEEFREELMHRNRFFPHDAPNKGKFEDLGEYIGKPAMMGAQKFYRARVNITGKPYPISKMGKPPPKRAKNGRANPIGIPYLYVASSIGTAIAEIRGHKGETVTIAEFITNTNLELADLRDPKNKVSPFNLVDERKLDLICEKLPFLVALGNELSKPVIPREADLEYLPSQYLCELLKQVGFHGIIYKSSIADGDNYVIFNHEKLDPIETYQYKITEMTIQSEKIA